MDSLQFPSAYVPHNIRAAISGTASGRLSGLTVAIKDMYDIAGERTGGGSPAWLDAQSPATVHSAIIKKILEAGGTIIGKTVCDEFFYSITGENFHYGTPINPRAKGRIPGGSSSGSASACSSGSCDIAIGSDTGGSVRVPAALCGIYGIRVSRARMDLQGAMSMAPSFDAGGWFASSPDIFARAGKILLNNWQTPGKNPRLFTRVADAFAIVDPEVADLCNRFLDAISDRIDATAEITIAGERIDNWREALRVTQAYEVWQNFGEFISSTNPRLGPGIAERMRIAQSITKNDVAGWSTVLDEATARMEEATAGRRILLLPTCPGIAPLVGSSAEEFENYRVRTMQLVCLCSISGLPQVTIPIGTVGGAPVGLSFIGWRNGDEELLELTQILTPAGGSQGSG